MYQLINWVERNNCVDKYNQPQSWKEGNHWQKLKLQLSTGIPGRKHPFGATKLESSAVFTDVKRCSFSPITNFSFIFLLHWAGAAWPAERPSSTVLCWTRGWWLWVTLHMHLSYQNFFRITRVQLFFIINVFKRKHVHLLWHLQNYIWAVKQPLSLEKEVNELHSQWLQIFKLK